MSDSTGYCEKKVSDSARFREKKVSGILDSTGILQEKKWTPRDSKTEILDSNGVLGEKVRLRSTPKKLDAAGL